MKHVKAAILFEIIVAVKNDSRGFQTVHVSFQSISSYNIAYVNDLNECTNFVELRQEKATDSCWEIMFEVNEQN